MRIKNRWYGAIIVFLFVFQFPLFSSEHSLIELKRLSENLIIMQTRTGNSRVAVLRSDKGLVMFDAGFSPSFTNELKLMAEKVFERIDWAYLIQTNPAVINNGGNRAFSGIPIIAHKDASTAFTEHQKELDAYLNDRSIEFEERVQRTKEQMKEIDPQSDRGIRMQAWHDLCQRMAVDFDEGFEIALPTIIFDDKLILHLGNSDLILFYFGGSAEPGDVICWVPQEGFVWLGDVFHAIHVLPYGPYGSRTADLPRWIDVFDQILKDENPVKHVYRCNGSDLWTAVTLQERRNFIEDIYEKTTKSDAQGMPLEDIFESLVNLDESFPYVSQWSNFNSQVVQSDIRRTVAALYKINHASAADHVGAMIDSQGIESTLDIFKKIKDDPGTNYYFLENEFNSLGYRLLGQHKIQEAIEVFKMNTILKPESANVYDSLGEAYMINEEKEKAIENYQKSLRLNPENTNAERILKRLKEE